MYEAISGDHIKQNLSGRAKQCQIAVFPCLSSTNTTTKQMAVQGEKEGLVVIAERQSAGRGRMNRSFFSPDGTGLYMSLLVRRTMPAADAVRLTTAAAVATAQAIEAVSGRDTQIKWVNDVYLDGKKVCGILTEGSLIPGTAMLDYAVIGIGVNIAPPKQGFPPEIADIATAILSSQAQVKQARERLAAQIISRMMDLLDGLSEKMIYEQYCCRSFLIGREITVHGGVYDGRRATALRIDENFRLLVRLDDGQEKALDSGEVSVKNR